MFNNDIYDSDINVSRLSSLKRSGEKEVFKTFECKKGMRMYSRLFLVTGGRTKFVFFNASGEEKIIEATKGDLVYLPDDIAYFSSWIDINEIDYISIEFQIKDKDEETIKAKLYSIEQESVNSRKRLAEKINEVKEELGIE